MEITHFLKNKLLLNKKENSVQHGKQHLLQIFITL